MSKELLAKYEYEIGPRKKYSTEYTWTLNDWSLLYGPTYSKGVTSSDFNLNGTIGTTCKLTICPINPVKGLTVEFSDTQGIEAMKITHRTGNSWSPPSYYYQPILKSYAYNTNNSLNRDSSDHTLKIGTTNALVIVIKITIVKVSDAFNALSSTVLPSQMLDTHDSLRNILANFKIMFDRKAFCDVTFVLGDKTFYAHKAVLAAQSKVFEAMFLSGMKEQNNKIKISDTDVEAFEQFLNYLYGGKIIGLQEMVEEMILIADFYNVSDLKIKCENVMLKSLSKSSAVRYLILADKLNCGALNKAALHLIRNSTTIFEGALLEEDAATLTCLKEILAKNRPAAHTEPIASDFSVAPLKFKI